VFSDSGTHSPSLLARRGIVELYVHSSPRR
jgi:hypothetical protein